MQNRQDIIDHYNGAADYGPFANEGRTAVVWVADGEPRRGSDYGVRVERVLAQDGFDVTRRSLPHAQLDPISADLHVLTGGATGVNDDCEWVSGAVDLVRSLLDGAARDEHAVLGICLGSQMIAHALAPGSVIAGSAIEVGLREVAFDNKKLVRVAQFHYEQIDEGVLVAAGARVVARNDHTAVQAFRQGAHVLGTQFHPELKPNDLRALILEHRATIEQKGGSVGAAVTSIDAHEHQWSATLFSELIRSIMVSPSS